MSRRYPGDSAVTYRLMAYYINANGFSPEYQTGERCGCFLHAAIAVPGTAELNALRAIVGGSFHEYSLVKAGWTARHKKDAVAACLIAADLVTP